jgi:hypothetical protein
VAYSLHYWPAKMPIMIENVQRVNGIVCVGLQSRNIHERCCFFIVSILVALGLVNGICGTHDDLAAGLS